MNTIAYLQFFDGLAEKRRGSFTLEKVSSKVGRLDLTGNNLTYFCDLLIGEEKYSGAGGSRKEALRSLYRKLNKYR